MPIDKDWDDWIDGFVMKIVQIFESECAKCRLEGGAKATKLKNELIHASAVSDFKFGSQVYINTVKFPKRHLNSNSIGQIYKAFLL